MLLQVILQTQQPNGGGASFFIMLGAMLLVMYLFMIRPQQKKMKKHKDFVENLKKGDKVVTNGGIHGRIASIDLTTLVLESETSRIKIEKSSISAELSAALNKTEEVKA